MYYRLYPNPTHPVQTIKEVYSAFPPWALFEGQAIQEPNDHSIYELEQIDEPLATGYGNFPLLSETKRLIRQDCYEFLVSLGVTNIQIFEAELVGLRDKLDLPNYFNFNIVGIIDFKLLRELANAFTNEPAVPPTATNMILLEDDEGTGNILVHEYIKTLIEAKFAGQIYFKAFTG